MPFGNRQTIHGGMPSRRGGGRRTRPCICYGTSRAESRQCRHDSGHHRDARAEALGAVRADQIGGVPVETVDQIERRIASDGHGGGIGVGQGQRRPGDRGRGRPYFRLASMRIDEVESTLVYPRRGHGSIDSNDTGQPLFAPRVADPDTPGHFGRRVSPRGNVPTTVDQSALDTGTDQWVESTLDGPTFDQSGRIESTWHRPRIKPTSGCVPSNSAQAEHLFELVGALSERQLAPAQSAERTVRYPGAEQGVGLVEDVTGPPESVGHGYASERARVNGEGNGRAHHLLDVGHRSVRNGAHRAIHAPTSLGRPNPEKVPMVGSMRRKADVGMTAGSWLKTRSARLILRNGQRQWNHQPLS